VVLDLPSPEALARVPSSLLARAEELWCPSPPAQEAAGGLRVSAVGPASPEGMDRALAAALARLGVVPTGPAGWPRRGAVPAGWPEERGPRTAPG